MKRCNLKLILSSRLGHTHHRCINRNHRMEPLTTPFLVLSLTQIHSSRMKQLRDDVNLVNEAIVARMMGSVCRSYGNELVQLFCASKGTRTTTD